MTAHAAEKKNHFLIVVNPKSGAYQKGTVQKRFAEIQSSYPDGIYYFSDGPALTERLQLAFREGVRLFAAAGGDGTVSMLANALRGKDATIGIVPIGTGNTLAQILNIPADPEKALRLLEIPAQTKRIDGFEVNGRLYFTYASAGLTSVSLKKMTPADKSIFGGLSYFLVGGREILGINPRQFSLEIDGTPFGFKAIEVFVVNAGPWGTLPAIFPESGFDDGQLEVYVIYRNTFREISNTALDLIAGGKLREIEFIGRGQRVTIECETGLPVQADGDIITETPVAVTAVPGAARFLVPFDDQNIK